MGVRLGLRPCFLIMQIVVLFRFKPLPRHIIFTPQKKDAVLKMKRCSFFTFFLKLIIYKLSYWIAKNKEKSQ